MKKYTVKIIAFGLFALLESSKLNAQNTVNAQQTQTEAELNTITTAVPFLLISPDSRAGALGDAGVSTSPDLSSIHWNVAKSAFIEGNMGFSLSYSPWLRNLVSDISLAYLTGFYKIDRRSVVSGSLRYFSLGDITFTDINGNVIGNFRPNEFALDVGYGLQLSRQFSFGMALRYINSNLTNGVNVNGTDTRAAQSVAADVSAYWFKDDLKISEYDATLRAGINISNLGAKMSYSDNDENDFLPSNLRLGSSLQLDFDFYNSMTFIVEANKLLVPSPATYLINSAGTVVRDPGGNPVVVSGRSSDVSIASGVFGSFGDAPGVVTAVNNDGSGVVLEEGSRLREELSEVNLSAGIEYWYDQQVAVRLGYFYENPLKGNRKYLTAGVGFKLSVFQFDASYLIGNAQTNPLAGSVRFSLGFSFDDFASQNKDK
ncbi:type IX secretion system outer membrane channel protein PorV [Vicingaceae bacterium]|nr:type IX secretion system outer membrane channel protein PorV [Vicingaceae bacterium]MDB4062043.1 type IX secretion system outer membrane channel protein PorV [Vicingaceae bacterium]